MKKSIYKITSLMLTIALIFTCALSSSANVQFDNLADSDFDLIFVDVTRFGAVEGDETVDNIPAINQAVSYLRSLGGGTLVFPTGTYYIKPSASSSNENAINMTYLSNVTISGNNSTIKVRRDAQQYRYIFNMSGSNIAMENLTIDANASGNRYIPLPASSSDSTQKEYRRHRLLTIENYSSNVSIRNVNFNGYGTQSLYVRGDNINIENCRFDFKAPVSPLAGDIQSGTNYIKWYDVSSLFAIGNNISVNNCTFTADVSETKNMTPNTAIETHASNMYITNTDIDGYNCGVLICDKSPSSNFDYNTSASDIYIDSCTITPVNGLQYSSTSSITQASAVTIWPLSRDTTNPNIDADGDIHDIWITNSALITPYHGIKVHNSDVRSLVKNVTIESNIIKYVGHEDTYAGTTGFQPINTKSMFNYHGTCAINALERYVSTDRFTISNNTIDNFPDTAVKFGFMSATGETATHDNVTLSDNLIYNCGYNYKIYDGTAVMALNSHTKSFNAHDNRFVFDKEGVYPLNPMALPTTFASENYTKMSYYNNSFAGYPDMSNYYKYNIDYTPDKFYFGYDPDESQSLIASSGITRLERGNIYADPDTGVYYRCLDSVYFSDAESETTSVTEVMQNQYAYKVDDISKFKIGDRIFSLTRRCYIYNIIDLGNNEGIIVGSTCGNGTSSQTPFHPNVTVGSTLYLDLLRTQSGITALRPNIEAY